MGCLTSTMQVNIKRVDKGQETQNGQTDVHLEKSIITVQSILDLKQGLLKKSEIL